MQSGFPTLPQRNHMIKWLATSEPVNDPAASFEEGILSILILRKKVDSVSMEIISNFYLNHADNCHQKRLKQPRDEIKITIFL